MDGTTFKTAIVVYSRSGHSKGIAKKLAACTNGTVIHLNAPIYRAGILGFLRAGYDSLRQNWTPAPQSFTTLGDFDQLIVCGPVWTSYPATPLRAFLRADPGLPEVIGLFLTSGGSTPATKAYEMAAADLGRPFTATATLGNSDEKTPREDTILQRFLKQMARLPDRQTDV